MKNLHEQHIRKLTKFGSVYIDTGYNHIKGSTVIFVSNTNPGTFSLK